MHIFSLDVKLAKQLQFK